MRTLRSLFLAASAATLGLQGCSSPAPEDRAYVSPDKSHWVHLETLPPDPAQDRLLPTLRLSLRERWARGGPTLLEGVETLCGTELRWEDAAHLTLRLPADRAPMLKMKDGEAWSGVTVGLRLHEDLVIKQAWSADMERRLVVIQTCESEDWNLYLRRRGEPNYNAAMQDGWDDPDLAGGFSFQQPALYIKWTGPRSAEIGIPGKRYDVTVRDKVGDVSLRWVFQKKYKAPEPVTQTLQPLGMDGKPLPTPTAAPK